MESERRKGLYYIKLSLNNMRFISYPYCCEGKVREFDEEFRAATVWGVSHGHLYNSTAFL